MNEGVGLVSYNPHFKGAITLLRMREEEQFSTSHGTEMFDFVMQVLVSKRMAKRMACWHSRTKSDVVSNVSSMVEQVTDNVRVANANRCANTY